VSTNDPLFIAVTPHSEKEWKREGGKEVKEMKENERRKKERE
jgi:hypothetical protein